MRKMSPLKCFHIVLGIVLVLIVAAARAHDRGPVCEWAFYPAGDFWLKTEGGEYDVVHHDLGQQLFNLALDAEEIEALQGKKVLVVGGGFGELEPYLLEQGVDTYGLDLVYGLMEQIPWIELRDQSHIEAIEAFGRIMDFHEAIDGRGGLTTDERMRATPELFTERGLQFDAVLIHLVSSNFRSTAQLDALLDTVLPLMARGARLRLVTATRPEAEATSPVELATMAGRVPRQLDHVKFVGFPGVLDKVQGQERNPVPAQFWRIEAQKVR